MINMTSTLQETRGVNEEDLPSNCANCRQEFINESDKITLICGNYAMNVQEDGSNSVGECERERFSSNENPVSIVETLFVIYGLPPEKIRNQQDNYALCRICADALANFYRGYQELQRLAHEASYISKRLIQIQHYVQKALSDENQEVNKSNENFGITNRSENVCNRRKQKRSPPTPRNVPSTAKANLQPNNYKSEEPRMAEEKDAGENVVSHDEIEDTPSDMDIVKTEVLHTEQIQEVTRALSNENFKLHKGKIDDGVTLPEELKIGSTQILSANGKIIRASTRTRKVKTPLDLGESSKTPMQPRRKKVKENDAQELVAVSTEEISSDVVSALWEICTEIYHKKEHLKILGDGKFICPAANCGKAFKGLKTLNKHSLMHDIDRPYHCSKCDRGFLNRQEIILHVRQYHLTPAQIVSPKDSLANVTSSEVDAVKKGVLDSNKNSNGKFRVKASKLTKIRKRSRMSLQKTEKFNCAHCEKTFSMKSMYERHLAYHENQTVMCRCTVCHQTFPSVTSLDRHIASVHDAKNEIKEESYSCPKCPLLEQSFKSYDALKSHFVNTHKKPFNYCIKCGKYFNSLNNLNSHCKTVHDMKLPISNDKIAEFERTMKKENDSGVLVDDLTSTVNPSASTVNNLEYDDSKESKYKSSNNQNHVDTVELFKCGQCNKEFKRKHQLNVHILFHNETEPRFGCSQCPKKFFQPNALRTHMLVHSMKNPFLCKECDKVFERRDHYKRHMEMVHDKTRFKKKRDKCANKEKKADPALTCPECKKSFSRKEYLRLHMRIHTGEKPYVCDLCGKQFRDPRNLAQHLVTHKTDRPFCCSVCGLTFKRAHHLNDHEGTHRQNVARPFVCSVAHCGKAFKLRKHLASHELVHTGAKDHRCHVCGRAFSRKDNLRQHINKIHGEKFAEGLLQVVEKQRERYQQEQLKSQSLINEYVDVENILDQSDSVESAGCSTEAHALVSNDSRDLPPDSEQLHDVLQIIPAEVVTTLALCSIAPAIISTTVYDNTYS